jgi:hypothetical protein
MMLPRKENRGCYGGGHDVSSALTSRGGHEPRGWKNNTARWGGEARATRRRDPRETQAYPDQFCLLSFSFLYFFDCFCLLSYFCTFLFITFHDTHAGRGQTKRRMGMPRGVTCARHGTRVHAAR